MMERSEKEEQVEGEVSACVRVIVRVDASSEVMNFLVENEEEEEEEGGKINSDIRSLEGFLVDERS